MTLAVLTGEGFWYELVYFLHILAIVVGFGPTFVYPVYAAMAKQRPPAEGLAVNSITLRINSRLEWVIYSVPIWGIIMVILADDQLISFEDAWISIGLGLYIVGLVVSLGFHLPNLRRMNALQEELVAAGPGPGGGPPPQVAELEARGRRAGMYGGLLHLILVAIIVDMVWKPGAPF